MVTWFSSEEILLRQLYTSGAGKEQITAALPRHDWSSIRRRVYKLGAKRPKHERLRHPLVERLYHRRVERGLTRRDLAARSGISRDTITRLEVGNSDKHLFRLDRWCRELGFELTLADSSQ